MAQSFSSQATGTPTSGEIEITKPSATSGDWTMEIYAVDGTGVPTGVALASTTIADSSVPTGNSRIIGTFAPGASLQAGVDYALSLTRPATWNLRDHINNCPGQEFRSLTAGGAWANDGAFSGSGEDFDFAVYVEPPVTPAPATSPTSQAPGGATCKGKPATIVGTEGNDVRSGTPGRDVMVGLGGNDTLAGLAGNDVICGGPGKDTLKGGGGADSLLGQAGKDALKGGGGKDLCKGGNGKDTAKCEVEKSI